MSETFGPIKLIIFDLDGTLIHSLPDIADAVNHVRRDFGKGALDLDEVRLLVGKGARSLIERALPDAGSREIDEALERYLGYNLAHIVDKTRPYPGVAETLEELSRRGFPLVVLSNKNVALCREVLSELGLAGLLPAVYGADSFPFRKPSPEPVLALLKEYRVAAGEAVLVGDSINDMAAGQGAGVYTVGCSYGYGNPEELAGADFQVHDFASLLDLPLFLQNNSAMKKG
ncbi:haloacid dehalogenase [Geomonas silvestris]|uniref:Phosphoglycolate phosphatase n=1 Tax=Geomonas silvestris TaxID=2740184 RepID=A0A6V8MP55_9BACT|nr:HAD-IA family hydrolase [Geomonas silvestris]GFO61667.1 haloacid dehalogenase [Geomonas silvestris]